MMGVATPVFPIRLCGIVGYEGRINDVVYCHPIVKTDNPSTIVFFGGDMQVGFLVLFVLKVSTIFFKKKYLFNK